ncbi:hypothetical protein D8674_006063 [Pyrus ussuriensis x Pyrus communis]|uniref:Non-structural maintenance of chromosomes element 1 homolog n=1 Tax=Pyrus ussuriensis x Pyrus communis TaxID=2448454 RepID=A0A5N5FT78_9ROSA|nr:hypothetical protein D8674_006063 [Pyrus ussuriensis x Pyrus communis]
MTELNSKHQTVIQALLSRGPLKEDHFHSLFTALTGKTPGSDRQKFDDFLLKINKALSYVQFEVRGCRNQYDGQVYYGVVNNVSDEESKLGTKYSVAQIAFYKAIIEAIVQDAAAQGTISNIDALNLRLENQVLVGSMSQSEGGLPHVPPALKNFSISQKEKTLDELVRDQWLSLTPDNYIGLGIRSFLDLRSWLRNNEVPPCEVCNEAGVKAVLCEKDGCSVRIHQYCAKKMSLQKKGGRVCPSCGTQWQYTVTKAEAVEEEPDYPTESQPHVGPKKKRLRRNEIGDGDVAECGSSQASIPGGPTPRRSSRNSIRLK